MKSERLCMSSQLGINKTYSRCRAGKASSPSRKSDFDSEEMQAYFRKLEELVPATRGLSGQGTDRTQLLQNVIDYIHQLQDTLDNGLKYEKVVLDCGEVVLINNKSTPATDPKRASVDQEVETVMMTKSWVKLPVMPDQLARLDSEVYRQ